MSRLYAAGTERPARTTPSSTASSAIESEVSGSISGKSSLLWAPKTSLAARVSWLAIQFLLPRTVLISPLWASIRKGCARRQVGKVLVE